MLPTPETRATAPSRTLVTSASTVSGAAPGQSARTVTTGRSMSGSSRTSTPSSAASPPITIRRFRTTIRTGRRTARAGRSMDRASARRARRRGRRADGGRAVLDDRQRARPGGPAARPPRPPARLPPARRRPGSRRRRAARCGPAPGRRTPLLQPPDIGAVAVPQHRDLRHAGPAPPFQADVDREGHAGQEAVLRVGHRRPHRQGPAFPGRGGCRSTRPSLAPAGRAGPPGGQGDWVSGDGRGRRTPPARRSPPPASTGRRAWRSAGRGRSDRRHRPAGCPGVPANGARTVRSSNAISARPQLQLRPAKVGTGSVDLQVPIPRRSVAPARTGAATCSACFHRKPAPGRPPPPRRRRRAGPAARPAATASPALEQHLRDRPGDRRVDGDRPRGATGADRLQHGHVGQHRHALRPPPGCRRRRESAPPPVPAAPPASRTCHHQPPARAAARISSTKAWRNRDMQASGGESGSAPGPPSATAPALPHDIRQYSPFAAIA